MRSSKLVNALLTVVFLTASVPALARDVAVENLRSEYQVNPIGLDMARPRLSWILASEERGQRQTAFQILVASSGGSLAGHHGDLWDSGKMTSDQSAQVEYGGTPLRSRARAWWKVRVWDKDGRLSRWSPPAQWTMGLLQPGDWHGEWIGASELLRAYPQPGASDAERNGYHATETKGETDEKWVQVDLRTPMPLESIRLHPARPRDFSPDSPGFGFPLRFKIELSDDSTFQTRSLIADHTAADYPNPGDKVQDFPAGGKTGRYVRVTANKLWRRPDGTYCFAFGEAQVMAGGTNIALGAPVTAKDAFEGSGWSLGYLTDGLNLAGGRAAADIAPAVLLRKEIRLKQKPARALVRLSGLGYSELYLNGQKVGDHVLDPGFTDYTRRVLYVTHEVTGLLGEGDNAIGVLLGGGWYDMPTRDVWGFHKAPWIAPPKLLLDLELEYRDGTREFIGSDTSWKWSAGPIVFNSVRGGETYDARREQPGWDRIHFNDSNWKAARIAASPAGRLQAQQHPPIRITQSIRPVKLTEPKPGVYVFDLGVNIAGWAQLRTHGAAGQVVTLHFNELLNPDGTVNTAQNAGLTYGRFQTGEFILQGKGLEVFEPRFTYHGFQYVQVTGLTEKPTLDSLTGRWVHTDPEPAGEFACSNPLINRLQEMILRTQLNNLHGIPTDCPQREKIGWTQDGCVSMEEAICNFQMATFYTKWFRDMVDAQEPNGHACPIAPSPAWGFSRPDGTPGELSDPWWGGAIVRTPWQLYRYYGDRRVLDEGYPAMVRYLDYVAQHAPNHIAWSQEGDWLEVDAPGPSRRTPPTLASTAAYFWYADIVRQIATLLNRPAEAKKYGELSAAIRASFNQRFLSPDTGLYPADSQTAPALALQFGLAPEDKRAGIVQELVRNIQETRKTHLSTGIVGTLYLFYALTDLGYSDLAYRILVQEAAPSWSRMLHEGSTTVWEAWDGGGSRNHPALGSVGAWFYQALAGIHPDPDGPGFKRIIIKPEIVADLTWAKGSLNSIHGRILSDWKREGGMLTLCVTIPPNTTATVSIPTKDAAAIQESGKPVSRVKGVKFLRQEDHAAAFQVRSGRYVFTSRGFSLERKAP